MREPDFLEWDSSFFGVRIARCNESRVDETRAGELLAWCRENQIECLYFLADPADSTTISALQRNSFEFVDIRATYFLKGIPDVEECLDVRLWRESDLPELIAIARLSHTDTRFFFDRRFSGRAPDLYETWIVRSCRNKFASAVLVAEQEGERAGYITCDTGENGTGAIGLVAVGEKHRGRGVGPRLVNAALRYLRQEGMSQVSVVTQGRNVAAQKLYQQKGFRTRSIGLWYHRWL